MLLNFWLALKVGQFTKVALLNFVFFVIKVKHVANLVRYSEAQIAERGHWNQIFDQHQHKVVWDLLQGEENVHDQKWCAYETTYY